VSYSKLVMPPMLVEFMDVPPPCPHYVLSSIIFFGKYVVRGQFGWYVVVELGKHNGRACGGVPSTVSSDVSDGFGEAYRTNHRSLRHKVVQSEQPEGSFLGGR
jgi:hypothetical protein